MAPDSLRPVWRTDPDDRWGMEKGKGGAVMLKVIVVDDERFVRMGIVGETDWASLGCEVVGEAENGLDALELVHEKNPELMICDIRMPKMNGLEMEASGREKSGTGDLSDRVQRVFLRQRGVEALCI